MGRTNKNTTVNSKENVRRKKKAGDGRVSTHSAEIWKCEGCSDSFDRDEEELIQCEYCMKCFCCQCLDLSTEEYNVYKSPSLHWFCSSCEEKVMKNIRVDREVETRCKEFMKSMENRISDIEKKLEEKVDESRLREVVNDIIKNNSVTSGNQTEKIEESVNKRLIELRDSNDRERNIIIHGIAEQTMSDPQSRKEADTLIVGQLADILQFDKAKLGNVVRLGKKDSMEQTAEGSSSMSHRLRPRPIRVTLSDNGAKRTFFKSLPKLKQIDENSIFRKVSISHDMSKEERDVENKLREEARERSSQSGGHRYVVRGPPWARRVVQMRGT